MRSAKYNGGLGAVPPVGSRAKPLVRRRSPPEAEAFLLIPSQILKFPEFNFVLFLANETETLPSGRCVNRR